ncbi:MAG: FAD-binding oxidoreductase, partial [Pararhodobacter sp.]|nr:FAD-binding oxidoreductase [Pararhodobacter sp.]
EAGRLYGAAGPDGEKHIVEIVHTMDALGQTYQRLDQSEMQARIGTRFYTRGLRAEGNALVNPAALMRGLATNLPPNVAVFEKSPVTSFARVGDGFIVQTRQGRVHCDRLVVAAGVYMAHFGIGAGRFVPMTTYASLTDPLDQDQLAHLGSGQAFGLLGASEFGSTIRLTQDKRLFVRNFYNFEPNHPVTESRLARIVAKHRRAMAHRWPRLADLPFRHSWGGTLAFTQNNGTIFGEYEPGLFAILTNDVSPMTRGEAAGGLLAEYMEKQDSDLLALQLASPGANRLPPRPFLDIGIGLRSSYLGVIAGRE